MSTILDNVGSPIFYQNYPRLFHAYFSTIEDAEFENLSIAGYAYYQSVLILDRIVDDRKTEELPKMIELQEKCIKLLTDLFGLSSSFWILWDKRKQEYFEAIKIENSLSENDTQILNFETYINLADKKSALGKVAIDALQSFKRLLQMKICMSNYLLLTGIFR